MDQGTAAVVAPLHKLELWLVCEVPRDLYQSTAAVSTQVQRVGTCCRAIRRYRL